MLPISKSPLVLAAITAFVLSCGDEAPETEVAEDTGGAGDVDAADAPGADQTDDADVVGADLPSDVEGDAIADVDGGEAPAWPETPTLRAYLERPVSSVLPASAESCALIDETRCSDGSIRECALWDSGAEDWAGEVPRMTEQAYYFDRYYDLYHDFEGMAVDVDLATPLPPEMTESEWSQPEHFEEMSAYGDASGWTGTALWGAAARFQATGTEADYARFLSRFEGMMFLYEVTGVPGLMARSHFGLLAEGAPAPAGHWGKALSTYFNGDGSGWHYSYPIAGEYLDRVPDYYDAGVEIDTTHYDTEPRWLGDASRDMYVRSMPGVMLAYDMLGVGPREDALRSVVERELPCTLNRLRYGRIENLQSAPELIEAVTSVLGGALDAEPDDLDFTTLDTIILFVMDQPNPAYPSSFDGACPDGPPLEPDPELVLDASSSTFVLELLSFAGRAQRSAAERQPIAWFQVPSIRTGDLLFMLQWATVAHYLTGDEAYLDFVDLLTSETEFEGVLNTYGSLVLPKWCRPYFGPSLAYPTLYNLLARIDPEDHPQTWQTLSQMAADEARGKEMAGLEDAFFGILYNRMWSEDTDDTGAAYADHFGELLSTYGIDPDNALVPDRNRSFNWLDPLVEGIEVEELSEADRALCEDPITVLGVEVPGPGLEDDNPRATEALPLWRRDIGGAILWAYDPWQVIRNRGTPYTRQYPMLGMTTPYWIGRSDGVIDEGADLALAWRDTGTECR